MKASGLMTSKAAVRGTQFGLLAFAVAAWYYFGTGGRVSPILLAPPDVVVLDTIPGLIRSGELWPHLWITVWEFVGAFAFSLIAGFAVGYWASSGTVYRTRLVEPVIVALYTVPIILLYPVILLIFGFGPMSKIIFGGIYGFFPVALNTSRGLQTVDTRYLTAARSMGASKRQLLTQVRIPAALPLIVTGVRVGAAFNLIGVITGELLASAKGMGHMISRSSATLRIPDLYSYILITLVIVGVVNTALSWFERRQHRA